MSIGIQNDTRHSLSLFKSCTLLYKQCPNISASTYIAAFEGGCKLGSLRIIGADLIDTLSVTFSLVNMLIHNSTLLPNYQSIYIICAVSVV